MERQVKLQVGEVEPDYVASQMGRRLKAELE